MKAVYVLKEMPTKCMDCPFHQWYAYGLTAETYCILTAKKNEDGINTKAEWCPLKPMPEYEKPQDPDETWEEMHVRMGYNKCLEDITNEP